MTTREEILRRLTEERDKISKEKQITDKWLQVRADKLFAEVTEETELENLIKFTIEVMPEMQANMNSVFKVESERIKEELAKTKTPEVIKKEVEPEVKYELPQEAKDAIEFARQFQSEKLVGDKKKAAFQIAKIGIGENQLPLLKLELDKLNVSSDIESEKIAEMGLKNFNDILQAGLVPTNIDVPSNTDNKVDKNLATYNEVKANILKKQ